ncbi:MAG: ROK family protein [Mycobacterium sp.]
MRSAPLTRHSDPTPRSTFIGVDLGGTKTAAGLVASDGQVLIELSAPTPALEGPSAIIGAVVDLTTRIRRQAAERGLSAPEGIGIGSAGVIDPQTGRVLAATDHLRAWAGTPLADSVSVATGLPTRAINDVHAHALGEALHGAGHGKAVVLVVAVGTGLGGALVIDGHPMSGARNVAGHLGHVPAPEAEGLPCACGGRGHLETVASGTGLLAHYRRRGGDADDTRQIIDTAASGDDLASDCVRVAAWALGRAVGGWINMLDPDVVVVTGGLAQAGPLWWDALERAARQETIAAAADCPIVRASRGAQAAILGAAALFGKSRP